MKVFILFMYLFFLTKVYIDLSSSVLSMIILFMIDVPGVVGISSLFYYLIYLPIFIAQNSIKTFKSYYLLILIVCF